VAKTGPTIAVTRKSGAAAFAKRLAGLSKLAAYVGVPAASADARSKQLLGMAGKAKGKARVAKLKKAAEQDVTNAELLFIHTKGSPARGIPARPVVEPAIAADGNKQAIEHELAKSMQATLAGDDGEAVRRMQRAALAGQNAARKWFTDPRNGWKENAEATIERKGSDRPLIDTGALRAAIVGLVREE
jgi:hypothetical protein